jgi:hypothetical protein
MTTLRPLSTSRSRPAAGLALAAALLGCLGGCTVRRSVLTTVPTAPPMAAPRGRAGVSMTGTVTTAVEPVQDPSEVHLWVPRGRMEAAGTVRVTRWFGMRPMVAFGFGQGALLERGGAGPGYSGDRPALTVGPGFLFRIEPDARLDVDLELDPLLSFVVETIERCGSTLCSSPEEDYAVAIGARGAVTVGYELTDFAGIHGGLALASHPTSPDDFGEPVAVPILRGGGYVSPTRFLDVTLDVQWPFANAVGTFGPTISLGVRAHFGGFAEPAAPAPGPSAKRASARSTRAATTDPGPAR